MNQRKSKWTVLVFAMGTILTLGACKKKVAPPSPPPPPAPPAPTASLTVSPTVVERGQSATLTWDTRNATDIIVDSIGSVPPSGSESVMPTESTTYHLTAKGPGGSETATARITVNAPPPPPAETPKPNLEELFSKNIKNIFFDFDKYDIRTDQQQAVQYDAKFLSEYPSLSFMIEGHCDERGSIEYNLALGDKRANRVKQALVESGVNSDRITTVTYGKERPFCSEQNEECWQENRQGHLVHQK